MKNKEVAQSKMPILMCWRYKNPRIVKIKVRVIKEESAQDRVKKETMRPVKPTSRIWLKMWILENLLMKKWSNQGPKELSPQRTVLWAASTWIISGQSK